MNMFGGSGKRDEQITLKLSSEEAQALRHWANRLDLDVSELVRKCIALGLPVLGSVPFARRVVLNDCTMVGKGQ